MLLIQNPELGFEEFKTSDFVAKKLEDMGLSVHRGLAGTGVRRGGRANEGLPCATAQRNRG